MTLFYVLVRRGHDGLGKPTCSVYVKDGNFFVKHGGLKQAIYEGWFPLMAMDVHHARAKAASL
jgi:hypothetical protein